MGGNGGNKCGAGGAHLRRFLADPPEKYREICRKTHSPPGKTKAKETPKSDDDDDDDDDDGFNLYSIYFRWW